MAKIKTNNDMVKALVKEVDNTHPLLMLVLRERLMKISEITKSAIEKNPTDFDNPIIHHSFYVDLCKIIDKHLGES